MSSDALSPRLALYGGAVLGGVFWGCAWLLARQAHEYQCAARGMCTAPPAWWDAAHQAGIFGHLWLVVAAGWLTTAIAGAFIMWLGRIRIIRSAGLALIAGPSAGWLVIAWMSIQQLMFGWRLLGDL